jgi:hypothetical protein
MSLKLSPGDNTLLKRPTRDSDSGTTFKSAQDTKNLRAVVFSRCLLEIPSDKDGSRIIGEGLLNYAVYGDFCHISMPLDLKNAGATYERCMQKCLHDHIGRNVHAYMDDIMVKSAKKRVI